MGGEDEGGDGDGDVMRVSGGSLFLQLKFEG